MRPLNFTFNDVYEHISHFASPSRANITHYVVCVVQMLRYVGSFFFVCFFSLFFVCFIQFALGINS